MEEIEEQRLRASAHYRLLAARRSRMAWGCTLLLLALYFAFDLASVYLPELLGRPLAPAGAISVGVFLAFALCVLAVALAAWYAHRANVDFAVLERRIREELRR